MAGVVCKTIIDQALIALIQSLERVLFDSELCSEFELPEIKRQEMIQRMANVDIAACTGDISLMPAKGLFGIVLELEEYGLVTDEVWKIYAKP